MWVVNRVAELHLLCCPLYTGVIDFVADHTPCLSYRRRASRAGYSQWVFLPQCQEDGSYSPLQCHEESGYCWCVTPQGRQVPHSAVKGGRPNCTRPAKTRRGSGPRGAPHGSRAWRRQKRGCGRNERSHFKNNLIKSFRAEYRRAALAAGELQQQ